jgi:hypothetical protein
MMSSPGLLRGMLWLIAGSLPVAAAGPNGLKYAPVPADPLELATGQIQTADSSGREAALQLLTRARGSYALRSAGQAYDLKVAFTVNGSSAESGEIEDWFVPGQGQRWTAKTASGYAFTGIASGGKLYGAGTANVVPLRLQEARGMLLDPVPSAAYAKRAAIRTTTATLQGKTVTCVLLTQARDAAIPTLGRGWEESEECMDPQSGLLMVHSEAPGHYAVYDYTNAPQFGGHVLPSQVTVSEGGRVVSKISVESIAAFTPSDGSLLTPTASMTAGGPTTAMTAAAKISRIHGEGPIAPAMIVRPVCVFGLVTPTGQLVEAHSLQPSDPNSDAAVEDARSIDFSPSIPAGAPPRQHFVFVIEKFLAAQ